jgi:hypothetical protein
LADALAAPGAGPVTIAARLIAAWVREQAEAKDYGAACEWRNVADAIEREAETSDWRCECGDLNRDHEAFCYRCGAGQPEEGAGPGGGTGTGPAQPRDSGDG